MQHFLSDNLFDQLRINTQATEEDIARSYDLLKRQVESGFMVNEEDQKKVQELSRYLQDKEYRIRSLVFHGGFGNQEWDQQLALLRKLMDKDKLVLKEWEDCFLSLYEVWDSPAFSPALLDSGHITKKDDPEDIAILGRVLNHLIKNILDVLLQRMEMCLKIGDRSAALLYLELLNKLSLKEDSLKKIALERLAQAFSGYILSKINELKSFGSKLRNQDNKFHAQAVISRIDRDTKDVVVPLVSQIQALEYSGKETLQREFDSFIENLVQLIGRFDKPEKADFYTKGDLLKKPDAVPSASEKKKDTRIERRIPAGAPQLAGGVSSAVGLDEIKKMASDGKIEVAKNLFKINRKKVKTPDQIQQYEKAAADPFFFMDEQHKKYSARNPFFTLKPTSCATEDGRSMKILWFRFIIPLIPVRALVFKEGEKEPLGRLLLPFKYQLMHFLVALIMAMALYGLFVIKGKGGYETKDNEAKELLSEVRSSDSMEDTLERALHLLSRQEFSQSQAYSDAFRLCLRLTEGVFYYYVKHRRVNTFLKRYGNAYLQLNRKDRLVIHHRLFRCIRNRLFENHYVSEDFFEWAIKMGDYESGRTLLLDRLHFHEQKNDVANVRKTLDMGRKYQIRFSGAILLPFAKRNILSPEEILLFCENQESIPETYWKEGILKIWECRSILNDDENLAVVQKTSNRFPELRCDLLAILLDVNKNAVYDWTKEIRQVFKAPSVEKRIKIIACRDLIRKDKMARALEVAKTIPIHPDNEALTYLSVPIFYAQKKWHQMIEFLENYQKKHALESYDKLLMGVAYIKQGDHQKGKDILQPLVNTYLEPYLVLWQELHSREKTVREDVNMKLKGKVGKYEAVARKIYLIQSDEEARQEKEKFILSEIASDFHVVKLKEKIATQQRFLDAVYAYTEAVIQLKNPAQLRPVRDMLYSIKKAFFSFDTDILLARVLLDSDKGASAKDILEETENLAFERKEYRPLLRLLSTFYELGWNDNRMKLAKRIFKKCDDQDFKDMTARQMGMQMADEDDKMDWLKKIKSKNSIDEAMIHLISIRIEKKKRNMNAALELSQRLTSWSQEKIKGIDDINLLKELGRELFRYYRLSGRVDALISAEYSLERAAVYDKRNSQLMNELWSVLWFRLLSDLFPSFPDLYLLSETNTDLLWACFDSVLETKTEKAFIEKVNDHPYFTRIKALLQKMNGSEWLSTITVPPGFFLLLRTEGVLWDGMMNLKRDSMASVPFSELWRRYPEEEDLIKKKMQSDLDFAKKNMKTTEEKNSPEYALVLLSYVKAEIQNWLYNDQTLKVGFDRLLENAELSRAIRGGIQIKRAVLVVKLYRLAFWHDPNKEALISLPPAMVIKKAILSGQGSKQNELNAILNEIKELYKESRPFFNEDMFVLLSLFENESPGISPELADIIHQEARWDFNNAKSQILRQSLKK
ncbi:MAG: hypothetical protein JW774_08730 [Candidatus Aureabacteria bacterium]|nr:hypothetical protein [Candidatus Auribacterota bacterium]